MQQTKKFSLTLFRQLAISEPLRVKTVYDEETAFHLPGETKDITLEFVRAKAA
jgi:hypothetical protein